MSRVVPVVSISSGLHVRLQFCGSVCMYRLHFCGSSLHVSVAVLWFQSACIGCSSVVPVCMYRLQFCGSSLHISVPVWGFSLHVLVPILHVSVPVCVNQSSLCIQFQSACTGFSLCIISQSNSCPSENPCTIPVYYFLFHIFLHILHFCSCSTVIF